MKTSDLRPGALPLNRRAVIAGTVALTGAASMLTLAGLPAVAAEDDVPLDELMKSEGLDELSMGPDDAKVTVVEYASMSCGHCRRFHEEVFPKLKEQYIEPGKVRFIFREFPLDNRAAAASMLARCIGGDKTFPMIEVLFEQQKDWAYVRGNPVPALLEIAKQVGFTEETFNKCLEDEALLAKLSKRRERAANVFGVTSTPTFFINGQRLKGGTVEDFAKVIDPMLAKS